MGLLTKIFGTKPTEQESEQLAQEALQAAEYMDKASKAEHITALADNLKSYKALAANSRQREIYQLSDIQQVIAEYIEREIFIHSPNLLGGKKNGASPLEKAIDDHLFAAQATLDGLVQGPECKEQVLHNVYQKLTASARELAKKAATHFDSTIVPAYERILKVLQDNFEMWGDNHIPSYNTMVADVEMPSFKRERIVFPSGVLVKMDDKECASHQLIYKSAINAHLRELQTAIASFNPMKLLLDETKNYLNSRVKNIEYCVGKVVCHAQEAEDIKSRVAASFDAYKSKTQSAQQWVLARQDALYRSIEKSAAQAQSQNPLYAQDSTMGTSIVAYSKDDVQQLAGQELKMQTQLQKLGRFTSHYTQVLEETAPEAVAAGTKIIQRYKFN